MGGAAATDYTVYTKKDLTLRRGEKAIVTLFTRKIHYSHIYRWSPPEAMEHSLVLHNQTDTAWTTGPCLALSSDQPLSEDLLKYTPKGGRGELPVTAAINVATREIGAGDRPQTESLFARQQQQLLRPRHAGRQAANPQLRKAAGRDHRRQSARRQAARGVGGREDLGRSDQTAIAGAQRLGPLDRNVEAGEEKTLTYQYERYVPSR